MVGAGAAGSRVSTALEHGLVGPARKVNYVGLCGGGLLVVVWVIGHCVFQGLGVEG